MLNKKSTWQIEAKNEQEALDIVCRKLKEGFGLKDFNPDELVTIRKIKVKKSFLGRAKKTVFEVTLNKELPITGKEDENDGEERGYPGQVNVDGFFTFKFTRKEILLKVSPPVGKGKMVSYSQLEKAIEERELVEVDWQMVQDAVREKAGKWVRIADRKPELDRDAEVDVRIEKNGLRAFLDYTPPLGGKFLSTGKLKSILADKGVVFGIKEERLQDIAKSRVRLSSYLIAEGFTPEHGRDSSLEYHFEIQSNKKVGKKREDGSIDFFDLDLVKSVSRGTKLATVLPPTKGKPGRNVYGEEITARDGQEKEIPAGEGTEFRDGAIYATIDGQPRLDKGRIVVNPVYVVNGDVNLSVGNINFKGSVVIKGSILEGFTVKARGDVEVGRSISGATVEAGGNIIVKNGIIGQNKSTVTAGGDIAAKFIESARIKAEGSVIVERGIMHSNVNSGKEIVVHGKGLIVGGRLEATSKIEGKVLGSSFATPTELVVGINPGFWNQLQEYREKVEQIEVNLDKVSKTISYLDKKDRLLRKDKHLYDKCVRTKRLLEEQLHHISHEKEKIEEKLKQNKSGEVIAREKIYPRVSIIIGNDSKVFRDQAGPSRLIREEGEIRVLPV